MNQCDILNKIFELKKEKSKFIFIQSYEKAAQIRDKERDLERKLLALEGIRVKDMDELYYQMRSYFNKNFEIDYSINYKEDIHKQFIRQMKLNELGI